MGRKSEQQINSFEETIKDWKCRHCYLNRNSITQNKYNTNSFRNGEYRCSMCEYCDMTNDLYRFRWDGQGELFTTFRTEHDNFMDRHKSKPKKVIPYKSPSLTCIKSKKPSYIKRINMDTFLEEQFKDDWKGDSIVSMSLNLFIKTDNNELSPSDKMITEKYEEYISNSKGTINDIIIKEYDNDNESLEDHYVDDSHTNTLCDYSVEVEFYGKEIKVNVI